MDDLVFSLNEIIAGSIFNLSTADALYCICIHKNTWCDCISCFDQDVLFSNVDTSEKQAKYKQEE